MSMRTLVPAMLLALTSGAALAASGAPAEQHFRAIASADVGHIMQQYADGATLQWVGGPLDGTYTGKEQIQSVWSKFAKAVAPTKFKVAYQLTAADPKGETVTANVEFEGHKTIKVRYVLVYRQGKLVDEIWQIDPKLHIG